MKQSYLISERNSELSLQPSKAIFLLLMVLFFCSFDNVVNAQCSITSTTSASTLSCGTSPLSSCGGILYIGDGSTSMSLKMDSDLNLLCLGPIRFIVRNKATLDFSGANKDLKLAAGSSVEFETGSDIYSGNGCSGSDRIYVGSSAVSNCIGSGSTPSFETFVINGGYSPINLSASPNSFCNSGSSIITATATISSGVIYKWYSAASGGTALYTGNPYSTGTISATKTYYVEATYSSPAYSTIRKAVTVTVNASPGTPGVITGTAVVCQGQSGVGYSVPAITNAASYTWAYSGTGATITNSTTRTPTLTFAMNATSGSLTVYGVNACSNGTISANYPITINSLPLTPIVGSTIQPDCVSANGSIVLSSLPTSGTIYQTGTVVKSYLITGTTMTISGLAAGTYKYSASNGACSSSATGNVVINSSITNVWTTGWSNGSPAAGQALVFSENYSSTGDLTACSVKVTGGKSVTIMSGHTLTITNEVVVLGILIFEDKASLVQINDAAINSGNIQYKRKTTSVLNSDYTYWSSPVANQKLNISSPYASGMFYSYDDFAIPENWKQETAATLMQIGKGYIIRGPQTSALPTFYDAIFEGIPNNGIKTISIGTTGTSNLLGNPYPSALNADLFLAANSTLVEGTIYLWTHNTAIQLAGNITNGTAGTGDYAYTSDDYASYNITGGVGVGTGNFLNGVQQILNKPTGKIAAGQAFFTTSKATGTSVTFNNSMRVAGNNSQFFKKRNSKTENSIEKNRVWLNLTNTQGAFKQTLIGYVTDATNDYDSLFDGESFNGNEFVDFYSVSQDKNLVIQGRALPFDENDTVPLGFKSTIDGAFTINLDQVDGSLTNQAVYIEDKLTNTIFDLKSGNYTFSTVAGTFDDRFTLKYTNKTLSVDTMDKEDGIMAFYSKNYITLIIKNNTDLIVNSVALFNMTGQNIDNWDVNDGEQSTIQISTKNINSGIYIVKIKTSKGESNKKIMVN